MPKGADSGGSRTCAIALQNCRSRSVGRPCRWSPFPHDDSASWRPGVKSLAKRYGALLTPEPGSDPRRRKAYCHVLRSTIDRSRSSSSANPESVVCRLASAEVSNRFEAGDAATSPKA